MKAQDIYHNTPIFQSPSLNARLGKEIFFKMDCHQPTRSFKIRGMAHLVEASVARGQNRFIASSGGNAGYSLAYAARRAGGQVHVVVPVTTHARMQALIAGEGATVEVHGASWQEAHELALVLAEQQGALYVPPFDDPLLWGGHASMIDECAAAMAEPDWVVAAVGGGGLLCGIMEGMERNGWQKAAFLAAETHGAASFAGAMAAGKLVTLDKIETIATSLGARRVAQEAFAWTQKRPVSSNLCSDAESVAGMKALADAFQVIVEPACGAALHTVFGGAPALADAKRVLVIVCGGAGVDGAGFASYLSQFGLV
jgi:L-serine/L-threonine ammonia-lyase